MARAITGPHSLTWTAWLITLPLSMLVATAPTSASSSRESWVGAVAALVVHLALAPIFATAIWLLRRANRITVTLVVYGGLGAVRTLCLMWFESAMGQPAWSDATLRVVVGVLLAIIGYGTIAVLLAQVDGFRQARRSLNEARSRVQAHSLVESDVVGIRIELEELSAAQGLSRQQLADELTRVVRELVRPASHRIYVVHEHGLPEQKVRPQRARLVLRGPRPWIVALVLEVGALPSVVSQVAAPVAAVNFVLAGLIITALGTAINRLVARLAPPQAERAGVAAIFIGIGYALVGFITMLVSQGVFVAAGATVPLYWLASPFAALWALFVSAASAARRQAYDSEEALALLLQREVSDAASAYMRMDSLARLMHGTVQGNLMAITMGLNSGAAPLDIPTAQERVRLVAITLSPKPDRQAAVEERGLDGEIESFMAVWSQAMPVQWEIPPTCVQSLSGAREDWLSIRAVLMEGLTNVVRHASDPRAVVRVASSPTGYAVEVQSPGSLAMTNPGRGIRDLAQTFPESHLTEHQGTVTLTVQVMAHEKAR